MSDQEVCELANRFKDSVFYKQLFRPYLEERKSEIVDGVDSLVQSDASKQRFSVLSGRRKELKELEETLEIWCKRGQYVKEE